MREQLLAHAKKKKRKVKIFIIKVFSWNHWFISTCKNKIKLFFFQRAFQTSGSFVLSVSHVFCSVIATTTASTVKIRDPWVGLASIKMICSSGTSQRWNINLASVFHLIKTSFWLPWLLDVLASWLSFFLTFMNLFLLSLSFFILETWFQSVAYPSELGHDDVWWQINNLKQQIITAKIKC